MNDEKLLQLIADSDPVPNAATLHPESGDESPLLLDIYQRSGIMGPRQEAVPQVQHPDRPTTNGQPGEPGPEKPHRRWRGPAVAAAVFTIVAVVGIGAWLASSGNGGEVADTPSVDMTGTWRGGTLDFREFNADGSYRTALTQAIENSVVDQGDYTVDGAVLHQSSNGESAACANGETATYTIESLDDGANGEERVLLVQNDDQCALRAADGDLTLVRLK